jgi:hypothetical protein
MYLPSEKTLATAGFHVDTPGLRAGGRAAGAPEAAGPAPQHSSMQEELERLRAENAHLRALLSRQAEQLNTGQPAAADSILCGLADTAPGRGEQPCGRAGAIGWEAGPHDLSAKQIERYSRQLILPSFGVAGAPQSRFAHSVPSPHQALHAGSLPAALCPTTAVHAMASVAAHSRVESGVLYAVV